MDRLIIDGSQGEGGGQILRSSLSLAALTQTPIELENIRAGRRKPGLLRQHLAAVHAAAQVCGARVEGAELGSSRLAFHPGPVRGGSFSFAVGTAGSATLVCQTVLPIVLLAEQEAELELQGGTHNPLAPPYDFLEQVYLPLLGRMGASVSAELIRAGFYPAGGGCFRVRIASESRLSPLVLVQREQVPVMRAWTLSCQLPGHIAERELLAVGAAFGLGAERLRQLHVPSPGPGNALCIRIGELTPELITAFGEKGVRAEAVAEQAISLARAYLAHDAPVGEHLADQLILPLALVGGEFRTGPLSSHTRTNVDVVRRFLGPESVTVAEDGKGARLHFPGAR